MVKIIQGRELLERQPREMALGSVDVDGFHYAFASDATVCGVFIGGRWFTLRWETPTARRFHGDVQQAARHLANIHKIV